MQLKSIVRPSGMRAFLTVWFGQSISLIGTSMLRFALVLWIWEQTGQATSVALATVFGMLPSVMFGPIAGAFVDRWNRKFTMLISDLATGTATIAMLLLISMESLQLWHVYLAIIFTGTFESFQWPAYSAAITTMVDKKHYARTSAMIGMAGSFSGIFAPPIAATLYVLIGLGGIFILDILSFSFAITTLLFVIIPQPAPREDDTTQNSIWQDALFGFQYIYQRPSLLGLQLVFFFGNLATSFVFILLAPMVLARTGNNELLAGLVSAAVSIGSFFGGLLISTRGGAEKHIHGALTGWIIVSLFGVTALGLGQNLTVWVVGAMVSGWFFALIATSNQAIWQAKIPPHYQGRVFSARRLISLISAPLMLIVAGPLADTVFEPALMPDGALAESVGLLVGTGPGAGIAFMFVIGGLSGALVGIVGYLIPAVRNIEDIIPDHDAEAAPPPVLEVEPVDTEPTEPSVA